MRTELSCKNEHYIEKHRYLELKHFCLQYPIWEKAAASLDSLINRPSDLMIFNKTQNVADPVAKAVESRDRYVGWMDTVKKAAKSTDKYFAPYILEAVTTGASYDQMNAKKRLACCRIVWYKMYREFFWILSHMRK